MLLPQRTIKLKDGTVEQWTVLTAEQFIDICAGKIAFDENKKQLRGAPIFKTFEEARFDQIIVKEPIKFDSNFNSSVYIVINSGVFENQFEISGGTFKNSFRISGGKFSSDVDITGGEFSSNVNITGGDFAEGINIYGGIFNKHFIVSGGTFSWGVNIYGGEFNHDFIISGGEFKEWVSIYDAYFKNCLNIIGGKFHTSMNIIGGFIEEIHIKKAILVDTFYIHGGCINKLRLEDSDFKKLHFEEEFPPLTIDRVMLMQSTPILINLIKGTFNELVFENAVADKDTIIQVNNLAINQVFFNNYNNLGYISFNNLVSNKRRYKKQIVTKKDGEQGKQVLESIPYTEQEPVFSIIHSSLGKMEFVGCDLASFDRFEFENANLLGAFFAGKKMPKELTVSKEKEETDAGFKSRQQQFGYGQLKEIFQKQGDKMQATEYYALEMQAYRETLKDKWYINSTEKVTLWFNKWSNNYGTSWWRALKFTLIVTVVAYTIYCLCLGQFFNPTSAGWDNFWLNIFPGFFEFFLVTHKMDFMTTHGVAHINGWAMLIDILGRIGIGYGIYQFVQAFRKHGKK